MDYKIILATLCAFVQVVVFGQKTVVGRIVDRDTSEPLIYVTIVDTKHQYGTYSDTLGVFTLNYNNESDSLKISYLGYKPIFTCVSDLKKNNTIRLESDPVKLNEVVVTNKTKRAKYIELGLFKKRTGGVVLPEPNRTMYCAFIPNTKPNDFMVMKSIRFVYELASDRKSINYPLRIHILKVSENGAPGEDMVHDNIIFNKYNYKRRWEQVAVVDISKYNIAMPKNGVFIAFEYILPSNDMETRKKTLGQGPCINCVESTKPTNQIWDKSFIENKWRKLEWGFRLSVGLTVEIKSKY